MPELIDTKHNEKSRRLMKVNYYQKNGKVKSSLKYYKRKFFNNQDAMKILNDETLTADDMLYKIKVFNIEHNLNKQ